MDGGAPKRDAAGNATAAHPGGDTVDLSFTRATPALQLKTAGDGPRIFKHSSGKDIHVHFYAGFPLTQGPEPIPTGVIFKGGKGGQGSSHFAYWVLMTAPCCKDACFVQILSSSKRVLTPAGGGPAVVLADIATPRIDAATLGKGGGRNRRW